jgi:RNA-directed DNA polymerase
MIESLRKEMQETLGISEEQLTRLILRSPHTYKVYEIPKRTGGVRTIAQPARETKFIQYWLIKTIFPRLPVHECATAYAAGSSILKNATAHKDNSYLAKFDFRNFFTSIKFDDLVQHFSMHLKNCLSMDDIRLVARVSCIKSKTNSELCLSIGAPSSPILSNSIMFEFDSAVISWCKERNIIYTRYADDLTFSTMEKGSTLHIEPFIRDVVRDLAYPTLRFNNQKTTHLSRKHQRRITGLIIDNQGKVSLGRDRKREISALIHRFSLGLLAKDEIYKLQGLLGFAKDVEPLFVSRMRGKYRSELIEEILKIRKSG